MRTTKSRSRSMTATFLSILVALVLVAGCTPKVVPVDGPQVSALMLTNVTDSAYDAVPLMWNVGKNKLQSSGTVVLHANNTNGEAKLCWLPPTPATTIDVVQQWGIKDELPLMTTKSQNDLDIYTPPVGMQYQEDFSAPYAQPFVRWYAGESESFLTTDDEIVKFSSQTALDGTIMTVTEKSMWQTAVPAPKMVTLTAAVPPGLARIGVLYGSGSTGKGFVLVEASPANAPINTPDSIWLLRMNSGVGTWVNCGDLSAFGGNLMAGQEPSFARVGSLLYFTHSHGKIGCIDTAAGSPSVTFPEKINTLLDKLLHGTPADTVGPLQSQLAGDGGTLIIWYPDVNWNGMYYAVDASGTVLGSLRADKTSVTSFDANGKQGSTLPLKDALNNVRLPSLDLFQANIF